MMLLTWIWHYNSAKHTSRHSCQALWPIIFILNSLVQACNFFPSQSATSTTNAHHNQSPMVRILSYWIMWRSYSSTKSNTNSNPNQPVGPRLGWDARSHVKHYNQFTITIVQFSVQPWSNSTSMVGLRLH